MKEIKKQEFNAFLSSKLNEPQQQAVQLHQGAILVIAGAGSGKTRVITSRIAHLMINEDAPPESIVALTFTNKAAGEMKERLHTFFGTNYKMPFVGTFHSFCLLQMRSNRHLLDKPDFTILDGDDQVSLVKSIIKRNALEKYATPSQLIYQISKLKNSYFLAETPDESLTHPRLKEVYLQYETEKQRSSCYDFDDLILCTLDLFNKNKDFKTKFQSVVKHVLVDEYQDTSKTQHLLLRHIALNHDNERALASLCVVGDEDQSIYSWRGATVTNMLKIKHEFAPCTVVKIEQNYRSVKPILDAANNLIEHNKLRNPKSLWSERKASHRIMLVSCRSGDQEAEVITHFVKQLPPEKLREVAILYRTHYQSRLIEEAFIHASIPYKIIGGIRFYERKEIKDLLAYLRLIANPFDRISLLRVINYPLRGLGDKFEEILMQTWQQQPFLDFQDLLKHLINEGVVTGAKLIAVKSFLSIFAGLHKSMSPASILDTLLIKTDFLSYLRKTLDDKEAETKIENVKEFAESVKIFEETFKGNDNLSPDDPFYTDGTKPSLDNFLFEVALLQEKIEDDETHDQVQMMSLHAAKGLEFDFVIITGLEEEILPSGKALTTNEELEEERRLFYVGVTRAKEYLMLTHASYRNRFGTIMHQVPSRFIKEIGSTLIKTIDTEKLHHMQIKDQLGSWVGIAPKQRDGLLTFQQFMPKHIAERKSLPEQKPISPIKKSTTLQTPTTGWHKNQHVTHKKFGTGIVTGVEKAEGEEYYITALFKMGKKILLSSFLEKD